MRTLWSVFSFLAVVHLLALLMAVGWLWHSQRLDSGRLNQIRDILSITVPEGKAAAAKETQALAEQKQREVDEALRQQPGLDSAGQLAALSVVRRQEEQTRRRLEDEKRMLLQQLAAAEAALAAKARELDAQRTAWDQAIAVDRTRKIDEQFLQTVRQYEQAAPKQAKQMLMDRSWKHGSGRCLPRCDERPGGDQDRARVQGRRRNRIGSEIAGGVADLRVDRERAPCRHSRGRRCAGCAERFAGRQRCQQCQSSRQR
jgi:hypothetical protein